MTSGYLKASMHRVLRSNAERLSLPFLVRTKPKALVNTAKHIDKAQARGEEVDRRALRVDSMTIERLWDMKGGWCTHYAFA